MLSRTARRLLAAALPLFAAASPAPPAAAAPAPAYDVVIRGGTIYDGSGKTPFTGDVGIKGDRIAFVGRRIRGRGKTEIDAAGLAVAPGFINMLSWATESLVVDGRGQSDVRQGVTLEVFGEGSSTGPLNAEMKAKEEARQADVRFPVEWTTLDEYLRMLERRGVSPNVASLVGASTVRVHEIGPNDVDPTPEQLERMKALVRQAMNDGALGVGSSLIYTPGAYAETPEIIALVREAGRCGGTYMSHLRDEGPRLLEAVDELIEIAEKAGTRAEIFHLKQSGRDNWSKLDAVIARVEAARARGIPITANMYTYAASATGFDAAMPLWVQEGGVEAWAARLKDPAQRARVIAEMRSLKGSEYMKLVVEEPEKALLLGFKTEALKPLTGKTLAEVAKMRGKTAEETVADLVAEDGTRVRVAYFVMSEANVTRQMTLPWMSFGSDASAQAPEGVFLKSSTHPRAYGTFARVLGKYARDEKTLSLQEAVRRLAALPAANLRIKERGTLRRGYFADVVAFDPASIRDHATFAKPQQFATGMRHVFVNGGHVIRDGEHTGAMPGRVVRGPGWNKCK
jgi:N-acyl-D-amino-acid deacylase